MALSKERILKRSVCYEIGPVFYQTKGRRSSSSAPLFDYCCEICLIFISETKNLRKGKIATVDLLKKMHYNRIVLLCPFFW